MDDLHLKVPVSLCADCGKINIWDVGNLVGGEVLGSLVDLVRDAFRSRGTVGEVVLDSKIFVWACSEISNDTLNDVFVTVAVVL